MSLDELSKQTRYSVYFGKVYAALGKINYFCWFCYSLDGNESAAVNYGSLRPQKSAVVGDQCYIAEA